MIETSKGVGLIIVILAYALPAEAVYSAVVVIMAAFALKISGIKHNIQVHRTPGKGVTISTGLGNWEELSENFNTWKEFSSF